MSEMHQKLPNNKNAMEMLHKLNNDGLTCKKIQEVLLQYFGYKWSTETIRRNRKKIASNPEETNNQPALSVPLPGLNDNEKANWFRDQFRKTHLYTTLISQFNTDEIDIYLEEYGNLCVQFSDIVTSEFFAIDDFIKHRLLINRQLVLMKSLQNTISELTLWSAMNPIKEDDSKEQKQLRVDHYRALDQSRSDLGRASERYDKLASERQKIYSSLSATRKDRIDDLRGGKENFFNLIAILQTSEKERNAHGKYAALTTIASEDIKTKFREPQELPDGTLEPLILDSGTFDIEKEFDV